MVAIIVPFVVAHLERERLRYQVGLERFGELRTLLDGAAERLIEAVTILVRIMTAPSDAVSDRLTELAVEVFRDQTRLSLRLGGEHEVVVTHQAAMSLLHGVEGRMRAKGTAPTTKEHASFSESTGEFLRAAGKVVALPATQSARIRRKS
jgi:hypothetical protein